MTKPFSYIQKLTLNNYLSENINPIDTTNHLSSFFRIEFSRQYNSNSEPNLQHDAA